MQHSFTNPPKIRCFVWQCHHIRLIYGFLSRVPKVGIFQLISFGYLTGLPELYKWNLRIVIVVLWSEWHERLCIRELSVNVNASFSDLLSLCKLPEMWLNFHCILVYIYMCSLCIIKNLDNQYTEIYESTTNYSKLLHSFNNYTIDVVQHMKKLLKLLIILYILTI